MTVTFPLTVMVECPSGSTVHSCAELPVYDGGWQPRPTSEPAAPVTLRPTVIVDGALCASSTAPAATFTLPTTLITASAAYRARARDRDAGVVPRRDLTTGAGVRHRRSRAGTVSHRRSTRERERSRNGKSPQNLEPHCFPHEHYLSFEAATGPSRCLHPTPPCAKVYVKTRKQLTRKADPWFAPRQQRHVDRANVSPYAA